MFYTAEDRGSHLGGAQDERVIHGKCNDKIYYRTPVVGRLVFRRRFDSFYGKEALLAVISGKGESVPLEDSRTVGIVRIADSEDAAHPLPFPSITVGEIPPECDGRIALLDPSSGRLFVSPDITTVNRYLPELRRRQSEPIPPFVMCGGKKIRLSVMRDAEDRELECNTVISLWESDECEEELYIRYSEMAERTVGRSLTISLSARSDYSIALRALMRGAVWGELSLLLCDILTESELTNFMKGLCAAFCELEAEGREFNGYLPRGLCIDSPYLLSISKELRGIDFFIFDLEKIISSLGGGRDEPPDDLILYALESVCRISEARGDICHGAILGERTLSEHICSRLADGGVSHFISAPHNISKICNLI